MREVAITLAARNRGLTAITLVIGALYVSADVAGPAWRDIALASMSLLGVLITWALRRFATDINDIKKLTREEQAKRGKQHAANRKILLAIVQTINDRAAEKLDMAELFENEEE